MTDFSTALRDAAYNVDTPTVNSTTLAVALAPIVKEVLDFKEEFVI